MTDQTSALEPRISIVPLGVTDMVTSRRFYEALGWTLSEKQSNDQVSFFQGRGIILGLYGAEPLAEDAGVK